MIAHVYILLCSDSTYYIGHTTNIERRMTEHASGNGCRYTKGRLPLLLMYLEQYRSRSKAMRREMQIKKLPKAHKSELMVCSHCEAEKREHLVEIREINREIFQNDIIPIPENVKGNPRPQTHNPYNNDLENIAYAKIVEIADEDERLLEKEWENWQLYLQGDKDAPLHWGIKRKADRIIYMLGRCLKPSEKHPMTISKRTIKIEQMKENKWDKWKLRIPVVNVRGGIWCKIEVLNNQHDLALVGIKKCELSRKAKRWEVRIFTLDREDKEVDTEIDEFGNKVAELKKRIEKSGGNIPSPPITT